jgi:hypothetical protein
MKPHYSESHNEHHELSQLLPWYVNKSLQGAELKAVESHLSTCLICNRELVQLQKLSKAVIQEGAFDSAAQASFTRLKSRLHTQPLTSADKVKQDGANSRVLKGEVHVSSPGKRGRLAIPLGYPALAMAAALLLSVTLLMPRLLMDGVQLSSNFKTLSDGQQEHMNTNEIRVVFAENVDQQQKSKILEQINGLFIGNPTPQGVYSVKLGKTIAAKELIQIVDSLRKDKKVIFAEPSSSLLSSMAENQ